MPELPGRKVGIVACSGEELAEGTVTRLAALKVLEQLARRDGDHLSAPLPGRGGGGPGVRSLLSDHRDRRLRKAVRGPRHRAALGQACGERRRDPTCLRGGGCAAPPPQSR